MAGVSSSTVAAFAFAAVDPVVMVKVQTVTVVEPVNSGQGLVPPPPFPPQFAPGVHPGGNGAGALVTVTVAVPALAS
jgi:hypothetical protein